MTDTPETDAARITEKNGCIAIFCGRHVVPVDFACRLERERDEAREEVRLESARVSASIMAIESLERDRAEAQLLVKTLSDQCDMIEEDKEYNAQLANQFKSERDQLKDYIESARRAGKNLKQTYQSLSKENSQLRENNAELLKSLGDVLNDWQYGYSASKYECTSYDIARELLTKAKEAKS